MFLSSLDDESKRNFLELAYKLAVSDNDYSESENDILNSFESEMGVTEIPDTSTVDDLIAYFSRKDLTVQRIVWLELYGMIMADDKITNEEQEIRSKIEKQFTLQKEDFEKISKAADDLKNVYAEIYHAIL